MAGRRLRSGWWAAGALCELVTEGCSFGDGRQFRWSLGGWEAVKVIGKSCWMGVCSVVAGEWGLVAGLGVVGGGGSFRVGIVRRLLFSW